MNESTDAARTTPREINKTIRYTMWSVFAAAGLPAARAGLVDEVDGMLAELADRGLVVRGWYDVAGLRADADVLVWWHAPAPEVLQEAYHRLRRTALGRRLRPVWSAMGLHRPAEFNKGHVPAFMSGENAYIAERERGYAAAQRILDDIRRLPITVREISEERVWRRRALKSTRRVSYADAFAVALTQELSATLVSGDPEIRALSHVVSVLWL